MLEVLFNFVFEVILYAVGRCFLRIITLGRFEDKKGSFMVSLVGLLVIIFVGIAVYSIGSKL